jgi:hypothetical protein
MKKYFSFLIIVFSFLLPIFYINAATGFVPGQIWYSPETLTEGNTVKIHTVVWNGDKNNLQAKVEFYDKNVILGTRDITVLPEQLKEVNITWKVTAGDHTISAKIISSSVTTNGKKENVVLENNKTEENKVFVPVTIKKADGEIATSSDVLKNELDKAGAKIGDVVPESVSTPVAETFTKVDTFRDVTSTKINEAKKATEEEIKLLNNPDSKKVVDVKIKDNKVSIEKEVAPSSTDKPIAYIKLFFLSVVGLIFGNKIVFYGLIVIVLFFILRAIYRKIKHR